jgi:hypothetical protein
MKIPYVYGVPSMDQCDVVETFWGYYVYRRIDDDCAKEKKKNQRKKRRRH